MMYFSAGGAFTGMKRQSRLKTEYLKADLRHGQQNVENETWRMAATGM
jgi:hypothetical protein